MNFDRIILEMKKKSFNLQEEGGNGSDSELDIDFRGDTVAAQKEVK